MDIDTLPPGTLLGVSDWHRIDQAAIDRFADLTRDHQFIHVDPERAVETPLGGTVAHGFLTLSMASHLLEQAVPDLQDGVREGLNYGFDRLRFLSPVQAGARIRGRFVLQGVEARQAAAPGRRARLLKIALAIEIEGAERPALVADWLVMQVLDAAG